MIYYYYYLIIKYYLKYETWKLNPYSAGATLVVRIWRL